MSTGERHVHVWRGQKAKFCACGRTPEDECVNGHPRTATNAYRNDRGIWCCRVCRRYHTARWRAEDMTPEQHDRIKANMRASAKDRHSLNRTAALAAYGGRCTCCHETEPVFLVIDHVNDDGAFHRKQLYKGDNRSGGSAPIYRWLRDNNYPPGFQVLCHNCNYAKSAGGCPHRGGDAQ